MLGNFEPKKITLDSVLLRCLWTKNHAVTPFECARSITWYNKKRVEISERQNRCCDDT